MLVVELRRGELELELKIDFDLLQNQFPHLLPVGELEVVVEHRGPVAELDAVGGVVIATLGQRVARTRRVAVAHGHEKILGGGRLEVHEARNYPILVGPASSIVLEFERGGRTIISKYTPRLNQVGVLLRPEAKFSCRVVVPFRTRQHLLGIFVLVHVNAVPALAVPAVVTFLLVIDQHVKVKVVRELERVLKQSVIAGGAGRGVRRRSDLIGLVG